LILRLPLLPCPARFHRLIAQAAAKSAQHRGKLLDGNLL
jgi:hypothetical protein